VLPKLPGQTQAEQIAFLYGLMFDYYESNNIAAKLDTLTLKMLGTKDKPKLRAKAAEVRALIDFGSALAQQRLSPVDVMEHTVILAAQHLKECYSFLSHNDYNHMSLATSCRMFCILLCELEKNNSFFESFQSNIFFKNFVRCLTSIHL